MRGERDALLLAAGQRRDRTMLVSLETDERERGANLVVDRGAVFALHPRAERDVAGDVAVREQRIVLEHQAQSPKVRRLAGEVGAVDRDPSAIRRDQSGDRAEDRALAASARTEERDDLARRDIEVDTVDGHGLPVGDPQAVDPERAQNSPRPGARNRSIRKIDVAVITISTVLIAIAAPKFDAPASDR